MRAVPLGWPFYFVYYGLAFLLLLAQKEETRKRHPDCPGPAGFLAILTAGGDANKLGFASDSYRLNPPSSPILSRPKGEIEKQRNLR